MIILFSHECVTVALSMFCILQRSVVVVVVVAVAVMTLVVNERKIFQLLWICDSLCVNSLFLIMSSLSTSRNMVRDV